MSRDPLEGVRPSDSFDPAEMRPHDALDQPVAASPVRTGSPGRSSKAMVIMLIGVLFAVGAGAAAFYLAERSSSAGPEAVTTAQPATRPTGQPGGNAADVVVQQDAVPAGTK